MTNALAAWPTVSDDYLEVKGRQVRILRADAAASRASTAGPHLLVHGLGGSSVTWVEVMEGLAEHGPVVAVDLPGFGRTPVNDDDPITVEWYVEFVLDVADALGWASFTLHGNSMGGLIGTLLAADHPDRVDRLVLVSPGLPPRTPVGFLRPSRATIEGMAPIALSSLTALALGAVGLAGPGLDERRNRALLRLIYPDPDGVDRAVLDLMAADFAEDAPGVDRRRALLAATCSISRLWADPRRSWRAVRGVRCPTLLLGGTKDALVPAKVLRSVLAARPDWEGHVLDDRRHALMLEDPESYLRIFGDWRVDELAA